jgi:nucleoside-diphosphate-sugar epimerase
VKILIVGGAGYIGSALIEKIKNNYEVEVVDLLWFGNNLDNKIKIVEEDIFNLKVNYLQQFDQVVFLGGLSNDPMAEFSPEKNYISNAAAPAYLAFQCKQAGVSRFIYASSCSVYGFTKDKEFDESSPTVSDYPYGISKLQGEFGVMQLQDKNFSVIALRQGTVSGYSPRMRLDLVINTMFKFAMNDKQITVNNPKIWRPILGIQDAIQAYKNSLKADFDLSGIFNVCSGNYTIGDIGDIVSKKVEQLSNRKIEVITKNVTDFRNYRVSIKSAQKLLNFSPKSSIESIVDELYNNREKFDDYENPNYYNIEIFKSHKNI